MFRTLLRRSDSLSVREARKVIAWHVGSPLHLDQLEAHLKEARLKTVRRIIPSVSQSTKRSVQPRDDSLLFSVTPELGALGPSPIIESMLVGAAKKTIVAFADGTVVGWNTTRSDLSKLVSVFGTEAPLQVSESVKYIFDASETGSIADSNTLVLPDDSDECKIPFSFALAQSVKLDVLDMALRPVIANVKEWQRRLSGSGRIDCSVKQLRRTKTQLLAVSDEMNFSHGVQTTPKLFWTAEFQPMRGYYKAARSHLEVDERFEVISDRIHAVNEALDYLHDEVHTETNELLTWVIIWLIVVEIGLALGVHRKIFVTAT